MNDFPLAAAEPLAREKIEEFDRQVAAIVRRYPPERKAAALLPVLRLAQESFGRLSPEVQQLAASRLGVSPARADEVATFYVMFHTRPVGRHLVELCTNVSCCLTGSERIWQHLKKKLGVGPNQTTADGRITLREVECLGSCGTAPAMLVDEEMHERLTVEKVDEILGRLS
ncbi:MAG TPA: NAD(P)H-dependent oxidoreductase subunit E [Anaeromyxobacter sp.]|nr:NAD(P)H-dependent oxidoreductase subunit E [Anaeromyxobacter sp.]